MTMFNSIQLIHTIGRFHAKVFANGCRCKTEFARGLHETLLQKLHEMAVDLHAELARERELADNKGTADGDEWYDIYQSCTRFELRWIESRPCPLLDPTHIDLPFENEICRVTRDYRLVPSQDLEGLGEILDELKRSTGVEFIVARAYE